MKIILSEMEKFWLAVERVMSATPRQSGQFSNVNGLCIEAENNQVVVHRYNSTGYAEHVLDCQIIEEGEIAIGDAKPFQFWKGQAELSSDGSKLSIIDLTNPRNTTEMPLVDSNPYLRIEPVGLNLVRLNHKIKDMDWTDNYKIDVWAIVILDGSTICTTNSYNFCMVDNIEPITHDGQVIVVPSEWLGTTKKNSLIAIDDKRVWIIDGDFACYTSTSDRSFSSGWIKNGIQAKLSPDNARVTVAKADLINALSYMFYMSTSSINPNGLCSLSLNGSYLILESTGEHSLGQATKEISGSNVQGKFSQLLMHPNLIKSAASVIDTDSIEIQIYIHQGGLSAFELIGNNVVCHIPALYPAMNPPSERAKK